MSGDIPRARRYVTRSLGREIRQARILLEGPIDYDAAKAIANRALTIAEGLASAEDLTGNSRVTVPSELLEEARTRLSVITAPSGYDRDIIRRLVEALDPVSESIPAPPSMN